MTPSKTCTGWVIAWCNPMRIKPGLRLRVALSFALLSMFLVITQTVAVFMVTDDREEEFINQILAEEMRSLIEQYRRNPEIAPPKDQSLHGYIVRSPKDYENLPEYLRKLPLGNHEILFGGKEFHAEVRKERQVVFYLLYDATRHEERIKDFRTFLLLGVFALAGVTVWLGFWLSALLVRQVSDLANRVASLDPSADHHALANAYRDEEVVKLASAFDHYHDRMTQLVQREKEFTANVSHELRTPLTSIKTGCELLTQDNQLQGKSRQRLETIAAAANRIEELTQALFYLAREVPVGESELVNLREVAEEALAPFRNKLAAKAVDAQIHIQPDATLRLNRPAVQLALTNLVKNAVAYTQRGSIAVRYQAGTLSVTDTGCGISEADLPNVFQRFYRGRTNFSRHEGSGLGLAIVKDIAERFGWRVTVKSRGNQGSTFAIEFPPYSQNLHS